MRVSGWEQRLSVVLAAVAFTSCSGGAGGSSVPPATAQPPVRWQNTAQIALEFSAPTVQTQRKPAYVSPSARSIRVTVNSVDGAPPPSWVTPNPSVINFVTSGASANCRISSSGEMCTLQVPGPPGNVSYTLELFDANDATGNELGSVTQTVTIAQGQTTPIDLTIGGLVASIAVSGAALVPSTSTPGVASYQRLSVAPKDADGNVITGTALDFANTVQLSITDRMEAASLSTGASPSCPGRASVTLNAPNQPVWLCYSGEATANVVISASVPGGGTIPVTLDAPVLANTALCTSAAGCVTTDPNYDAPTLFFGATSGPGATRTLSVTEPGWTQAPYDGQFDLTLDPSTCGTGSNAIVSAPVNPAISWSLSALRTGICKGILTEHTAAPLRKSGTAVWFSVTDASVTGS